MNRLIATVVLTSLSAAVAAEPSADTPPAAYSNIRTYTQDLTIDFASADDAIKAVVRAAPVFEGKTWALSARWDDNSMLSVPVHDAMVRQGVKGTFYINESRGNMGLPFVKSLTSGDCDIGVHTQTHPWFPGMLPNEIFWEILANRVQRESEQEKPIITLAFPSGAWRDANDPRVAEAVTKAFLNSGLTHTTYMDFAQKNPAAPKYEISTTHQVQPGDHQVNPEGFDKQINSVLHSGERGAEETHLISYGVHGRQQGEELTKLEAIFAKYAKNPDWWYCTMNEYGAYDRQFHTTKITADAPSGASRTYHLTREIAPELGANVPLTLEVLGAAAKGVKGDSDVEIIDASGRTLVNVGHAAAELCPTKIDAIDNANNAAEMPAGAASKDFPDFFAWLSCGDGEKALKLTLKNGGAAMNGVTVDFRLPPKFGAGVIKVPTFDLAAGESKTIDQLLGDATAENFYTEGRPYYVAEIGFRRGNDIGRLYATTRLPAAAASEVGIRDAAQMLGPWPNDGVKLESLADQSKPDAALAAVGDTANLQWFAANADDRVKYGPDRLTLYRHDKAWLDIAKKVDNKPQNYLVAADFTLSEPATIKITSAAKVQGMLINGALANGEVQGVAGKNRVILSLLTSDARATWCVFPLYLKLTPSAGTLQFTATPAK